MTARDISGRRAQFRCEVPLGELRLSDGYVLSRSVYCTACKPTLPDGCPGTCVPAQGSWGEPPCELRESCPCWEQFPLARVLAYQRWLFKWLRDWEAGEYHDAPVRRNRQMIEREEAKPACPRCGEPRTSRAKLCKACRTAERGEELAMARWGRQAA